MIGTELLEEFLFPRVSEAKHEEERTFFGRGFKMFGVFTASEEDSYTEESTP